MPPKYSEWKPPKSNLVYSEELTKMFNATFVKISNYKQINDILADCNAVIAGGCVLSCIHNSKINDYDIYVHMRNAKKLCSKLIDMGFTYKNENSYLMSPYDKSFFRKNNILGRFHFFNEDKSVDILVTKNTIKLDNIVSNFDLSFCKVYYDGKKVYALDIESIKNKKGDLSKEYLDNFVINNNFYTLTRLYKYIYRYNYDITNVNKKEILDNVFFLVLDIRIHSFEMSTEEKINIIDKRNYYNINTNHITHIPQKTTSTSSTTEQCLISLNNKMIKRFTKDIINYIDDDEKNESFDSEFQGIYLREIKIIIMEKIKTTFSDSNLLVLLDNDGLKLLLFLFLEIDNFEDVITFASKYQNLIDINIIKNVIFFENFIIPMYIFKFLPLKNNTTEIDNFVLTITSLQNILNIPHEDTPFVRLKILFGTWKYFNVCKYFNFYIGVYILFESLTYLDFNILSYSPEAEVIILAENLTLTKNTFLKFYNKFHRKFNNSFIVKILNIFFSRKYLISEEELNLLKTNEVLAKESIISSIEKNTLKFIEEQPKWKTYCSMIYDKLSYQELLIILFNVGIDKIDDTRIFNLTKEQICQFLDNDYEKINSKDLPDVVFTLNCTNDNDPYSLEPFSEIGDDNTFVFTENGKNFCISRESLRELIERNPMYPTPTDVNEYTKISFKNSQTNFTDFRNKIRDFINKGKKDIHKPYIISIPKEDNYLSTINRIFSVLNNSDPYLNSIFLLEMSSDNFNDFINIIGDRIDLSEFYWNHQENLLERKYNLIVYLESRYRNDMDILAILISEAQNELSNLEEF